MPAMTTHPMRQKDQHFTVTGAGTGIGRAIALRLAEEGANLSLVGRREAPLQETADSARSLGTSVLIRSCDVRDRHQVDEAFGQAAAELGPCAVSSPTQASVGSTSPARMTASMTWSLRT